MLELMSKRIDAIDQRVNEMSKRIDELSKYPHDDGDDLMIGMLQQNSDKTINPNAENYTVELASGPYTIYRNDDESDQSWERRKDHMMDQRITFLNGSGQNGTPEQVAHLKKLGLIESENISENPLTQLETTATLRPQR